MNITILGQNGLPVLCACGQQATTWRLNTLDQQVYYCDQHDPAGPPCPLCGGAGKLGS